MPSNLPENEIIALISLLDEKEDDLSNQIINNLIECGNKAMPFLLDFSNDNLDDILETRIYYIIDKIQYNDTTDKLIKWNIAENKSLLEAWIIITQYFSYLDDEQLFIDYINKTKYDIWVELNDSQTALEKIKIFNHVFFQLHKIKIDKHYLSNPDSFLLENIILNKIGAPFAISLLYQIIANKLEIPLLGLNYLEYSMLAYIKNESKTKSIKTLTKDDILFYIIITDKLNVVATKDIDIIFNQFNIPIEDRIYTPCSQNETINILLTSIMNSYNQIKGFNIVKNFESFLKIIN